MTALAPTSIAPGLVLHAERLEPAPRVDADELAGDVRRAQGGDELAFGALYRACRGRVYAVCLRLEGDAARAEELMQDVFVRAWERLGSFRGESRFATWLHRLTINVVLQDRRASWRRDRRFLVDDEAVGSQAAPEAGAGAVDLDEALRRLPPGARAVFVLHDIDGYQHGEIAALLGIAEGTSKTQLFRARRLLRGMLR